MWKGNLNPYDYLGNYHENLLKSCFAFCLAAILCSCDKEYESRPQTIESQFHGKYSIVSASADKEIDINLDGQRSKDVLKEIPELTFSYLELIVRNNSSEGVFSQFWQYQYFYGVEGKPVTYDPSIFVNFRNDATVAMFKVDSRKEFLTLSRSYTDLNYPLPISVEIMKGDMIKIIHRKEVFTPDGWTTVTFEVLYKRLSFTF